MPRYEAIALLLSLDENKYIQPGEVFEIPEDESDRAQILLAAGLIKPAVIAKTKKETEEAKE